MFVRQLQINGEWIDERLIAWRHIDRCDGCGDEVPERDQFHFRANVYNDSILSGEMGMIVHPNKGCVLAALRALTDSRLDRFEALPD